MKTRILLLVFVILLIRYTVLAQVTTPQIGVQWYYSTQFMTPDMGYYRLEYVNDTTIDQKHCKIIEGIDVNPNKQITSRSFFYMLFEKGRIYQYTNFNFYVLYDFNVRVGDTIKTSYPSKANPQTEILMNLKITEVKDTLLNDALLKTYTFHTVDVDKTTEYIEFFGTAIENVGNITNYFFPINHIVTDWEKPSDFRCYQNSDWSFKSEVFKNKPCDFTYLFNPNALDVNLFDTDIKLMFDENSNSIILRDVDIAALHLTIYDYLGRICFNDTIQRDVPIYITRLHSGVYFFVAQHGLELFTMKILKR